MSTSNPESLFSLHNQELKAAIDDTLSVIENVNQFQTQQPSFSLDYPNAEGNLAVSHCFLFTIL
jgi:hypothetical protein